MKVFYASGFDVSHNDEAFSLVFRFSSPDGETITTYVIISPSGAKTLAEALHQDVERYEKEFGELHTWGKKNSKAKRNCEENNSTYVS